MADGDIKIYHLLASARTTGTGGTSASFSPAAPSIADGETWLVQATAWRTMETVADNSDGIFVRAWEKWMNVQDIGDGGVGNPLGCRYSVSSTLVLAVETNVIAGEADDTIDLDYVGGLRLWFNAADTEDRRWFARVTIYVGIGTFE
jgi:hypothetical protein